MIRIIALIILITPCFTNAQTAALFGGDPVASGYANSSNTANKWTKFGEITLNGAYNAGTLLVDFFPDESPHGDSRQTAIVSLRNSSTTYNTSHYDIVLMTSYGANLTVKDLKVVHTSGSVVSNNTFSVWFQFGATWVSYVPIEVRTKGNITYNTTNGVYKPSIDDTGTFYDCTSKYGMYGSDFVVEGKIRSTEVKVEAEWWDEVFEEDYDLMTIDALEQFIKTQKHLPDLPTEVEVVENGVEIGNTVSLLVKKVEELTLYIIEQNNRIKVLEEKLTSLDDSNKYESP